MASVNQSIKHLQIDKANTFMVASIAAASFVVVFSLVASKALLSQRNYQSRVISAKAKAVNQLKDNVNATQTLVNSYTAFVSEPENVLGGNPKGTGDNDGDNAKIVLDALPSKYDFPALATSLQKIMTSKGLSINGITGTDDELNQQDTSSPEPKPVPMPFQISANGSYQSIQKLIDSMQRSIRPFQIQTLNLSSNSGGNIQVGISAQTFYQPQKSLSITTKEIK